MRIKEYIRDKIISVLIYCITVFFVWLFLFVFDVHTFLIIYIPTTLILTGVIILIIGYMRRKNYYYDILNKIDKLDKKYYIQELIKRPEFTEGKVLYDVIAESSKSMIEDINKYKYKQEEYKEYIELWIHEVKTPIASSKLIIENNKNNITKSIDEELDKINNYVEQALYYARSSVVEKDYIIKKYSLKTIVNNVIIKNKKDLINKKIILDIEDIDISVNTDIKWMEYILNQIITNSIKYCNKENPKIKIYTSIAKESISLCIEDNGIGISDSEIPNVFDKGFTGTNGRHYEKSTGMGLYLCKLLMQKLGQDIKVSSKLGEGTTTKLIFHLNSYINNVV